MKKIELEKILDDAFSQNDFRASHRKVAPLMQQLAGDKEFFSDIVLDYARDPKIHLQKRINPVVAVPVFANERYSLIAHGWLPREDKDVNITHQSIHHHGKLLLTSVAAFGQGYDSIIFRPGFEINGAEAKMKPEKLYRAHQGLVEFVEVDTPHVVFYPSETSVTYALWSQDHFNAAAALKKNPLLQTIKKPLKALAKATGLSASLGINIVSNFDFSVRDGKLYVLPERIQYQAGDHENFVEALFFLLSEIKMDGREQLQKNLQQSGNSTLLLSAASRFLNGGSFKNKFSPNHLWIPDVNIKREDLLNLYPNLRTA